jgi:hypothetical protein
VLLDQADNATKLKRVVTVEIFDETRIATEGTFAFYLNTASYSGTRPWNGTLPAGRIQLRIRVALVEAPGGSSTIQNDDRKVRDRRTCRRFLA